MANGAATGERWGLRTGRRVALIAAAAMVVDACARRPEPPADGMRVDENVQPGAAFRLARGRVASIDGTSIRLRFDGVTEDSRCPSGVQCVWAGNARVALRLERVGTPASVDTVSLMLEPRSVGYSGYTVRLEALEPAPVPNQPPAPDRYVATFTVTPVNR